VFLISCRAALPGFSHKSISGEFNAIIQPV
jgi:hypothetical protein